MVKHKGVFRKKAVFFGKGPVRYTLPKGKGTDAPIEIRIDFSLAPPPPNYFYANAVSLQLDKPLLMAALSFGQRRPPSDKVSQRIDVAMPTAALLGVFWQTTRSVEAAVDKVLQQLPGPVGQRVSTFDVEPNVTLFANVIHIAVGASDTTMDFYCLSSRDVYAAKMSNQEISLQPIVRVYMSTVLTKSFFDLLRPHALNMGKSVDMPKGGTKHAAIVG